MIARVSLLLLLLASWSQSFAYKIIAPMPFSIVNRNYIKLQVLAEQDDLPADSIFFDIIYNSGNKIHQRLDASLSSVITLNEFNDGVFFIRAIVFNKSKIDTLGTRYDPSGIPVILDRHLTNNETTFDAAFINSAADRVAYFKNVKKDHFTCNNNQVDFASAWDKDSIYFHFEVNDAQLNYADPQYWNLFQAKKFLKVLWTSDCIEIGFDLKQDRSEWKTEDDYEFLVDVKGNFIGNQWNAADSVYRNWGNQTNVLVNHFGTLNNNKDVDSGYSIQLSIPWKEFTFKPSPGQAIGFDIQVYDKDGDLDDAFRSSISGTNPESNDNTSEWTSLILQKPAGKSLSYPWLVVIVIALLALSYFQFRRRSKRIVQPAKITEEPILHQEPIYSESINKSIQYIADNYPEPELSRQQIAEQVFLSEKYLSSLFKKETGTHLVTYINNIRIARAIDLLKTTRLSISEIAFKVGYNSLQNFNKNFKATTGMAPTEYRKGTS